MPQATRALSALVGVLVLTGCGGSGQAASSPSPTTTNTPTTVPSVPGTGTQLATDHALAQHAGLRLADVPAGYKSLPAENTPANDVPAAVAAHFSACTHVALPVVTTLLDQRAGPGMVLVASPNFVKSASSLVGTSIESAVEVHASSKELSRELDQLGSAGALPCWKAFIEAAVIGPTGSSAALRALDVASVPLGSLGDQSAAVGANVAVSNGARTIDISLDFCIVRRGRADALLAFAVEGGGSVDRALERSLLAKIVGRLQTAAGI
jgi:hypothetical protein